MHYAEFGEDEVGLLRFECLVDLSATHVDQKETERCTAVRNQGVRRQQVEVDRTEGGQARQSKLDA
jgi:hypothetical protein